MQIVRIMSLTVVAAIAGLSLVGADTASATLLCKINALPCGESNMYLTGTQIEGESEGNALLKGFNSRG